MEIPLIPTYSRTIPFGPGFGPEERDPQKHHPIEHLMVARAHFLPNLVVLRPL